MLSIVIQIHRNILSSQCYIRYVDDSYSVDNVQVGCFPSKLEILLLGNGEIIKKIKIKTPSEFFVPSSISSNTGYSVNSSSTIECQTISMPVEKSVAKSNFRLQISEPDKFNNAELELKVDVKDFFKERFKNCAHWDLFCASCGAHLPVDPLCVENVREYCESELSEGWFCHGNGPQPPVQPSYKILYLDDVSFYLYAEPNISCKTARDLVKKCISNHDTGCQKNFDIANSSILSCANFSDTKCLSKHVNCHDSENVDLSLSQGCSSFHVSATHFKDDKQINSDDFKSKCTVIETKKDLNYGFMVSSVDSNINSNNKKVDLACNCNYTAVDKNDCLDGFKSIHSAIECWSCKEILGAEKPTTPFIRFYFDKLMLKNSSIDESHLEYTEKITLLSFWSLVRKSRTPLLPSKLFLESKVRGQELCLLLWIPSAPIDQFLLQDFLENIPLEMDLKMEPVYKVLYFVGTSLSENVRSWRYDFSVDFYHVSDTMVKTLARLLDASSSHLPKTSEAGGFSCGFIRAPS